MLDNAPNQMPERLPAHGGDLAEARRRFPNARQPWIDLSTGINPMAYPLPLLDPRIWARLPQRDDLRRLEAVAASAYGCGAGAHVVAAPGTQALIQWLPRLARGGCVGVLDTTYHEHAAAWRASGAAVTIVPGLDALNQYDVGLLVNPNNPDGRLIRASDLAALARSFAAKGGMLVIDEAFMDAMPAGASFVPQLPIQGTLVLRSFGKMFGLAGLRLGFAVTGHVLADKLRRALGPWPVSGPALHVGAEALADAAWLADARERLPREAARLDAELRRGGFNIIGGTPLFRLAQHLKAENWFERLGRAGIHVRRFDSRPDQLRLGLPGSEEAWGRLSGALDDEIAVDA